MKTSDIIIDTINRLPVGYIFTYSDFNIQVNQLTALTKALSRMVGQGRIRKLSPGRFYKPHLTDFGELKPDPYQIVKDLLIQNGKIIGYLTGFSVFNQLGLTTQVSGMIQIGSNEPRKSMTRDIYKIRFIKQPNKITKENIPLLQILDAISKIREIPDTTIDQSCNTLSRLIAKLNDKDKEAFIRLAKTYGPAIRALAGAIFENNFGTAGSEVLYKSLNPSTAYKYGISLNVLPNKQNWNII